MSQSTVLHELNGPVRDRAATLGVDVHHSDLDLLGFVNQGDRSVDWVVIARYCHLCVEGEVRAVVADTFLHFQTIGVGIEYILVVYPCEVPLSDDLKALVIDDGYLEHLNLKLYGLNTLTKSDQGLIHSCISSISVDNSKLSSKLPLVSFNRLEGRVGVGILVLELGNKNVCATNSGVGR